MTGPPGQQGNEAKGERGKAEGAAEAARGMRREGCAKGRRGDRRRVISAFDGWESGFLFADGFVPAFFISHVGGESVLKERNSVSLDFRIRTKHRPVPMLPSLITCAARAKRNYQDRTSKIE